MSMGWYRIPRSSMASSRAPTTYRASWRSGRGRKRGEPPSKLLKGKIKTTPEAEREKGLPWQKQGPRGWASSQPRPQDTAGPGTGLSEHTRLNWVLA